MTSKKASFLLIFLNMDISITNTLLVHNTYMEGKVSQNFDICPIFFYDQKRETFYYFLKDSLLHFIK